MQLHVLRVSRAQLLLSTHWGAELAKSLLLLAEENVRVPQRIILNASVQ